MASKKFEEGSEEWKMFREYWFLCQKFWEPEDNDEYWDQVVEATNEFHEKYKAKNDVFAIKIAIAFVDTIEEKLKSRH